MTGRHCGDCQLKPSPKRLRSLLRYRKRDGLFKWRSPSSRQAKGWFKGNKGVRKYRRIWIDGHHYLAHVVAYTIVKGRWPQHDVDHKNRDQDDNSWLNLRHLPEQMNAYNRSINRNNTTGYRGVSRFGNRFRAVIHANKKRIELGLFDTAVDAGSAWHLAAKKFYGEVYAIT